MMRKALMRWFLHPTVQLIGGTFLVTAAELLLKVGATRTFEASGSADWTGLSSLGSAWVWGGIACYIASFVSWLYVLRLVPLIVAFNVMNLVHVEVAVGSWLILGETVPALRWAGISLILCGVALIAKPLATLEEKL